MATRQAQSREGYGGSLLALEGGSGTGGLVDSLVVPTYQTGYWYDRRQGLPTPSVTVANSTAPAGTTIYFCPYYLHKAVTIDRLAMCSGSTATGLTFRLGTYQNNASNLPGNLLTDYGTVNLTGSAGTLVTLTVAATLPKGWFWFAMASGSGTSGTVCSYGSAATVITPGWPGTGIPDASFTFASITSNALGYSLLFNYSAALPATAPGGIAPYTTPPMVFFRAA